MARAATATCENARTRSGLPIRGRSQVNRTAPMAIPARNNARTAVKTYV